MRLLLNLLFGRRCLFGQHSRIVNEVDAYFRARCLVDFVQARGKQILKLLDVVILLFILVSIEQLDIFA